MENPIKCPECGSSDGSWHCKAVNKSSVVDGRLRMHDMDVEFFRGCNECSWTIIVMSGDRMCELINAEEI